jgi:hypothetical protein
MITGANSGGKSTFLRSLGLAELMMQSGLFVTARNCRRDFKLIPAPPLPTSYGTDIYHRIGGCLGERDSCPD